MKKLWKQIIGYEGYYLISNHGDVKSMDRYVNSKNGSIAFKTGKLIKTSKRGDYVSVNLTRENKEKTFSVHRLVAISFVDNPNNHKEVNHIDGNKLNNHSENLEWCTRSQNEQHAYDNYLQISRKGSKHHSSKLSELDIANMFFDFKNGITRKEISDKFEISYSNTCKILKGRIWKHASNLIEKDEAIDMNTLETNRYK